MHVAIRPHDIFQRDGANIYCRVPLRLTQAALGGDVEVPVIDGTRAKVKVTPGTQTGDQFRLRGKGFSVLRSAARGDMYVQVAVETPQHLTKRQRELLEEFEAEASGTRPAAPKARGSSPRWPPSSTAGRDGGTPARSACRRCRGSPRNRCGDVPAARHGGPPRRC